MLTTPTGRSPGGTANAARSASHFSVGTPKKHAPKPASTAASSRIIAAMPASMSQ